MKRALSILLAISILIPNPIFVFAENTENSSETVEFIIRYDSDAFMEQQTDNFSIIINEEENIETILENQLSNNDVLEIKDEVIVSDSIKTQLVALSTNNIEQTLIELNSISGIIYAEPNYRIYKTTSDPGFSNQWALNGTSEFGVNIEEAWDFTMGNDDVVVAVIDTGIDITHEDLENNIFTNENEVVNNQDDDGNGYIDDINGWDFTTYQNINSNGDNTVYDGTIIDEENVDAHGTHIAGIIAAELNNTGICGVAPNITVLPVKVLDSTGGTVFHAIKAMEYAEQMGAKIANCSWSSESYSHFLYDTMNNSDMLFICAAGNDGLDCEEYSIYPASYDLDNVISVGAIDSNGNLAEFSNYGTNVDIAAPGTVIYSTLPDNSYGYMDGTSMAAPHVTGVAALLLSIAEELTSVELKHRILNTTEIVNNLDTTILTSGIINASKCMFTTVAPTDLNTERYGNEILVVNGEIYSIGGYDGVQYINTIEKFSPFTQTWDNITTIPIAVADSSVAYYNNKIIIVGGLNVNPVNNVQIYNIDTNEWTVGAELPQSVYGSGYIQKDDTLYLFGGISYNGYTNKVFQYNIPNNSWQIKTNMQYNNAYSVAVDVDNAIYVLGGVGNKSVLDDIYVYNPEQDVFLDEGKLRVSRKDFSVIVNDKKIYVFGGSNSFTSQERNKLFSFNDSTGAYIESLLNTVEIYDTKTRMSTVTDTLDKAVMGVSAYQYFENVYLTGGWNGNYSNSTIKYFGASIPKNIRFKTKNDKVTVRWNPITEATGYQIEFDDMLYNTEISLYEQMVEDVEHRVRIRAVKDNDVSLWSDYAYYYLNSSLLDAREISPNSVNTDKLYEKGQQRWYKINNNEAGTINISLESVPENCDYVVQLCDLGGKTIATGVAENNAFLIKDVVLNPYPYYIKVFSTYGGDATADYILNCSFVSADASEIPDRIKSAFLRPSYLDDLSTDNAEYIDVTEYEGTDIPPIDVSAIAETEQNNIATDGAARSAEIFNETENENTEEISTLSLFDSQEKNGTMGSQGSSISGSVTVPANVGSSGNKIKLVVAVVPGNDNDIFKLEWTGNNTDYKNFWWHCHGDNQYYLTALLDRTSSSKTYNYKMTYDYKSSGSNGAYTLKIYIITDVSLNEDFKNTAGNDNPTTADVISVSSNSSNTYTGKLDHMYDWDFYKISVSTNQKIAAYLISPSGYRYGVNLLDHTGDSTYVSKSQYFDGFYGDKEDAYSAIQTTNSREYLILVSSDYGVTPDETYTLQVFRYNTSSLGDLEVNDTKTQADDKKTSFTNNYLGTSTKCATAIDFSIDFPADVDYYAVDLSKGDKLSVLMELPSTYSDFIYQYRIGIVDGEYIHSYNNPDSMYSKYVTFIAEKSGTHYVAVRSLQSKYSYSMIGTLKITKTLSTEMDINEVTTKYIPGYGEGSATNDFIFNTLFSLSGKEYGIDAKNDATDNISAKLDNELDVDWYRFVNGSESKTSFIDLNASDTMKSAVDIVVFDARFNLLNSVTDGKMYTFSANEKYYIAVCAKTEQYSNIINNNVYTLNVNLEELRSDLIFEPLSWGTFIYDNDPEFLTNDDLADSTLGNRFLMSADNLTGVVDFQSSHSVKKYMLEEGNISFDILLYNPLNETVTVTIERIGYQLPKENEINWSDINQTERSWAALQAWADFLNVDLIEKLDLSGDSYTSDSTFQGKKEYNYHSYYHSDKTSLIHEMGMITIPGGTAKWLLGDLRPTMTKEDWQPFNLVGRMSISAGGTINMGIAAFRDVSDVYTPEPATLIYDLTQRNYPTQNDLGEKYNIVEYYPVEGDIDGKPKGIVFSAAEVETRTCWNITETTEYFKPTVYNMYAPTGNTVYGWVTNFNPVEDKDNYARGVESDILNMTFDSVDIDGNNKHWIFDTRHAKPSLGNYELSGTPPIPEAMPLGNYGVIERYYIDINNTTDTEKKVKYKIIGNSHVIVTYKDGNSWKTKVKVIVEDRKGWDEETKTYSEPWDVYEERISADMFTISLKPHEQRQLIMETILPNADKGGITSLMYVE